MLKIESVSEDHPVWELSGFETSELNISFPEKRKQEYVLPIDEKRISVSLPKEETEFGKKWQEGTSQILEYLRSEKCMKQCPEVKRMWPSGFSRLSWDEPYRYVTIIKDSAGFSMHPHIDNREVIGVLIVNLHDNPKGTGTKFLNYPYEVGNEDIWYESPTKKNTGVFFLNNWNTWHKIENSTDETRYIAINSLHISQLMRN